MDLENSSGPEAKRRRLGTNHGVNGNGGGVGKRITTGPRTRGMMESSSIGNDGDEGSNSNGPIEKLAAFDDSGTGTAGTSSTGDGDGERVEEKPESSSDMSSSESSDSSDSEDSSGKLLVDCCYLSMIPAPITGAK